jgi:hypothetical protein
MVLIPDPPRIETLRLIPTLLILRTLISEPVMVPRFNIPLEEERDLTFTKNKYVLKLIMLG